MPGQTELLIQFSFGSGNSFIYLIFNINISWCEDVEVEIGIFCRIESLPADAQFIFYLTAGGRRAEQIGRGYSGSKPFPRFVNFFIRINLNPDSVGHKIFDRDPVTAHQHIV